MIYAYVNALAPVLDLDTFLSNLSTEQLSNEEVRVVCDPSVALTVNLPRCQNYPIGNLKILITDTTGQAAINNITINAAPATASKPADKLNGVAVGTVNTNYGFAYCLMVYPSYGGDITTGGAWTGLGI